VVGRLLPAAGVAQGPRAAQSREPVAAFGSFELENEAVAVALPAQTARIYLSEVDAT